MDNNIEHQENDDATRNENSQDQKYFKAMGNPLAAIEKPSTIKTFRTDSTDELKVGCKHEK